MSGCFFCLRVRLSSSVVILMWNFWHKNDTQHRNLKPVFGVFQPSGSTCSVLCCADSHSIRYACMWNGNISKSVGIIFTSIEESYTTWPVLCHSCFSDTISMRMWAYASVYECIWTCAMWIISHYVYASSFFQRVCSVYLYFIEKLNGERSTGQKFLHFHFSSGKSPTYFVGIGNITFPQNTLTSRRYARLWIQNRCTRNG